MRTILLMVWANIKSKKLQSFALAAVFVSVSILFFLSMDLFGATEDYSKLYTESKSSQSLIYANNETAKDLIVDFLESNDEISNVNVQVNYNNIIDANIIFEDKTVPLPEVFLTEYTNTEYDQITIIDGKSPEELLEDEVIFSYGKSKINNLEVGDTVVIKTKDQQKVLTIAGIGVDLTYNFDTISLNRFWTSLETIESLETEDREYSIGVSYYDYSAESEQVIMDELNLVLNAYGSDSLILTHALILEGNSFFQVVMGAVFTFIGVILVVVGLFIIRSIIFNNILTESKKIATLKSTGFSSNQIVSLYLFEYGIIGFFSIIIGFFGSVFLGDVVFGDLTELSNLFGVTNPINIIQTGIILVIILIMIELTVYLAAKNVSNVMPALALNRGDHIKETKQEVSLIKHQKAPVSLVLAMKDIMYNKRMFITLVLFIIATSFTIVSLSSTSYSLNSQKDNLALWLGYDIDASIVSETPFDLETHEEIITKLESSEYIAGTVSKINDFNSKLYDGIQGKYITAISEVFITSDPNTIDFDIVDGRVPENENEVMLGHNMLVSLEKTLGSYVKVKTLGEPRELLIVGEYQGFTNQGMSFRMFLDEVPQEYINDTSIQVKFIPSVEQSVLNNEIDSLFGSDVTLELEKANASMLSMFDILSLVTAGVIGIFAVICLVVLLNLNITNINKERFNYGVYKSIGMDNAMIIKIYLLKNSIVNVIGILVGGIIGMISLPYIVSAMTGSLGINQFPTSFSVISILISIGIVFGVTLLNAIIIKQKVSSISPKELLVE